MPGLRRGRSGYGKITRQPHEGVHLRITATDTQDHHAINVPVSPTPTQNASGRPRRLLATVGGSKLGQEAPPTPSMAISARLTAYVRLAHVGVRR